MSNKANSQGHRQEGRKMMENKIIVNHYSYRLQWSADDVDYVR